MLTHIHPSSPRFAFGFVQIKSSRLPAQCPDPCSGPPSAQSRFADVWCYHRSRQVKACRRRTLPLLRRSYRLMRQTKTLPRPCFVGLYPGSLQVLPVPAGSWPFPTLVLQSVLRCLDPYPAASVWCVYPFLPRQLRPHLTRNRFGTRNIPCTTTSHRGAYFGAAVIR